jgi:putative oxidoreductase
MATDVITSHTSPRVTAGPAHAHDAAQFLVPIGRALFVAIFLMAAPEHFAQGTAERAAAQGVPLASIAVPLSGIVALAGGLSVLLGYHARIGAWLLVLFLVPVTLTMHRFWGIPDPSAAQMQQIMFMKNMGLLGGALLLAYFGAGPISVDARRGRA